MHKYADWELFGMFICEAVEKNMDEIEVFINSWSHGDWDDLDRDWPEWVEFIGRQGK